jgi:hypothetical protein
MLYSVLIRQLAGERFAGCPGEGIQEVAGGAVWGVGKGNSEGYRLWEKFIIKP